MDMNEYMLEILARERLAEMRAEGERSTRIWAAGSATRPARRAVGDVVRRIGGRLRSLLGYSLTSIAAGDAVSRKTTSTHGGLRG